MIDVSKLPFSLEIIGKIKSDSKLFEIYPVLNNYDAFRSKLPISFPRAFELIVLLYSITSPLVLKHDTAKVEAAEYFGYQVKNGEIVNEKIKSLLYGDDYSFNAMVIAYCRMQKNAKFSKLVTYIDAYYEALKGIRFGGTDREKIKDLLIVADKLEKDIDTLTNEFLNSDTNEKIRNGLFDEIENVSLGLRPEDIADKLANGEVPVDVYPYGKDYSFEKYGDRTKINPYSND